jgi:hypothetical protein
MPKNEHADVGNVLSQNIQTAADNAESGDVVEATPGSKERILYLLKLLITLVENDRLRASQIEGMTTEQILDLAEAKAREAESGAQELKDTQD